LSEITDFKSGTQCAYCGEDGDTLDHVIPKSKGGLGLRNNKVVACRSCNSSKRNKPLHEWKGNSEVYGPILSARDLAVERCQQLVVKGFLTQAEVDIFISVLNSNVDLIVTAVPEKEFFYE
jgi:hypothetical protein